MFNDYPISAVNNALKGIELNKKNGNKCSTSVGKKKARDISKRKNLSLTELKKIFSYLSRAKTYYNKNDLSACGTISFLMWGGDPMLRYSRKKLNEQKKINQKLKNMNGFSRAVVSPTEEMDGMEDLNGFSRMNYIIDGTTLNEGVEDMDDLDGYTLSGFTLNGRTARRIRRFYRKNAPWSYVGTAVLGLILVDVATGGKVRETLGMSKTKKKK